MITASMFEWGLAFTLLLAVRANFVHVFTDGNNVAGEDTCYETTWQCYGAHTSMPENFQETQYGPTSFTYVDGQATTTISGHVSELEYVATVTGVQITFLVLEVDEGDPEYKLRVVHSFTHTADRTGLIKVPLDLEVRARSRIGFEVNIGDGTQVPIDYRYNKVDGSPYTSFSGALQSDRVREFDSQSVNKQYNFRMCFDLARLEQQCPYVTLPPLCAPCIPDPCQNGGVCLPEDCATYTCKCPTGFEGDNCEIDARHCYETTWQCFGAHTSRPALFTETARGPLCYVDGQSTLFIGGHVKELEYVAQVTGVEIRFLIMELASGGANSLPQEHVLNTVHTISHVADRTGLIKVPVDLIVKSRSRIAFEVYGRSQVPMNYRNPDVPYKSFEDQPGSPNPKVFPSTSVEKQFNFRICFDLARDEVTCPYH